MIMMMNTDNIIIIILFEAFLRLLIVCCTQMKHVPGQKLRNQFVLTQVTSNCLINYTLNMGV
jgi:hypothetical protein